MGEEGWRLTLSPAVPPDWMHSTRSPGGQITQTPVSVTELLVGCAGALRMGPQPQSRKKDQERERQESKRKQTLTDPPLHGPPALPPLIFLVSMGTVTT